MSPAPEWIEAQLASAEPRLRLRGRNFTKADILVYGREGSELAVKDYSARPWPVRNTVGRFMIRREARAYRAAEGIAGIPEFFGRVGAFALATRWIDGRPLDLSPPGSVDGSVFDALEAVLDALHGRGIALADLNHRDVLVAADGSVHLVDLATAWLLGERPGGLRRALFDRLRDADRVAAARMRARWTGGDEAGAAARIGPRAAAWHRRGRALRRAWDRLRRA